MSLKQTILVVEDEAPLRNIVRDKLVKDGYDVLTAKDGQEGVALALDKHPGLILLDINMPVMDGIAALKLIRADDWGKTAKVIMLTNYSDYGSVADTLALGTLDFLVKSDWKIEALMSVVREKFDFS